MSEIEKGKAGVLFSDFLKEQGSYEATTEQAIKRVIAFQLASAMEEKALPKWRWQGSLKQVVRS